MAYEGAMPPSNPKDGDTYDYHGYVYTYIADKEVWKLNG